MNFQIFLGLGSNLNDRSKILEKAREDIGNTIGKITQTSAVIETAPWGGIEQPNYLNQVIEVHTPFFPLKILGLMQQIEQHAGRIRKEKWGSRTLDIDLLYFENWHFHTPNLIVPHPFIAERDFVLSPLVEIAPDFIHPVYKKSSLELLKNLG